jgi:cysteinyl-tRNA synthetase
MNDDFNSPILIANLFDAVRIINTVNDDKAQISGEDLALLTETYKTFVFDVLGLADEAAGSNTELVDGLMNLILELRKKVRENKDYASSDKIRDELQKLRIQVKDGKDGVSWTMD